MFTILTLVDIKIDNFCIEADTVLNLKQLEDGTLAGYYQGYTFDLDPSEYVRLTTLPSHLTH